MSDKADTYCGKCIKADVCGMEGVYDPATTFCAYRVEARPKGEWIKNDNGTYSCSVCQLWIPEEQYFYARYCLHCGTTMRNSGEMSRAKAIEKVKDMRDFIIKEHSPNDVFVFHMNEAIKVLSEAPQCKFKSKINCDLCAFHSDCDEHWKEGEENGN